MYLKLAWRNIWRNHRRTLITVSSIMFAVVFALFIESLERGAHDLMVDNMTRFHTGYIQIQDDRFEEEPSLDNSYYLDDAFLGRLAMSSPDISLLVPRMETFMLASGSEQTRGAMVLGVDLEAEQELNELQSRLTMGRFFEPGDGTAVMGEGLAARLNLAPGDSLVLLGQGRFGMTAAGIFEVGGLMRHPVREMNNQMVYLSLPDAQWLLSAEDYVTSLLVIPSSARLSDSVAEQIRNELTGEPFNVFTWQEMMPELLEALEFDRVQTRFMMVILYIIIGFGIFGTILTMTLERMREFGTLLSVGMYRWKLAFVLFLEAFMITILGVASGSLLGLGVLTWFYFNPIRLQEDMAELVLEFGFEPIMPTALAPDIFLWQGSIIFVITLFISLYPSFKIMRMNILEAARG